MAEGDPREQNNAANIPLSVDAIQRFKEIWLEVTGESIGLQTAADHGRRLLAMYKFVYKPMTREQYEQLQQTIGKPTRETNDE